MFSGDGDFDAAIKAAYPDMTEEELTKTFNKTAESRDLSVRLYLEILKGTSGDFKMDVGTIAYIDFMKATNGNEAYENAEIETFLPLHQKEVDDGAKGSWDLVRIMCPTGTEAYASHLTINMFSGFDQVFNSPQGNWNDNLSDETQKKVEEGIQTRDMKWTSIATLIKKVR